MCGLGSVCLSRLGAQVLLAYPQTARRRTSARAGCITTVRLGKSGVCGRRWTRVKGWGRRIEALRALGAGGLVAGLLTSLSLPASGSSPMAPVSAAVQAAQAEGVVFGQTLAEAQVVTALRAQNTADLAGLARRMLQHLPETPGRVRLRHLAGMTEASANGSGGSVVEVEGNDTAFDRSIWVSLQSGSASAQTVGERALRLGAVLQAETGGPSQAVAAARGVCAGTCSGLSPAEAASRWMQSAGARVVERVGSSAMVVMLGDTPGVPAVNSAGREINLEVVAVRTTRGLWVEIGEPFVPPTWVMPRAG